MASPSCFVQLGLGNWTQTFLILPCSRSRHGGKAAKRPAVVYDIEGGVDQASIPADDFSGVVLNNVLQHGYKPGGTRGARTCVWNPAQSDTVSSFESTAKKKALVVKRIPNH